MRNISLQLQCKRQDTYIDTSPHSSAPASSIHHDILYISTRSSFDVVLNIWLIIGFSVRQVDMVLILPLGGAQKNKIAEYTIVLMNLY